MFNLVIQTVKNSNQINWWQVVTPFITALASFGAVYFGAYLTDKRKEKNEHKQNINNAIVLHTLIELQTPALIEYRDNVLMPKKQAIKEGNLTVATEKYPFTSWELPIDIKEYHFLVNMDKGSISALNQILKFEEQLNNAINIFDNFTLTEDEKRAANHTQIYIIKMKCIIDTLYETCSNLIFYLLILHRYLSYILTDIYKEKITLSDTLMQKNLVEEAQNNNVKLGWLNLLPKGWQCAKYPQEIKTN